MPGLLMILVILTMIVIYFCAGVYLYADAPEKKDYGFVKYLNLFMIDAAPGFSKNVLVYDDSAQRLRVFLFCRWSYVVSFALLTLIVLYIKLLNHG